MNNIIKISFSGVKSAVLLLCLMLSINVAAQQIKLTGKVTDETGGPFIGVNVMVKGSSTGVATDINGAYSLNTTKGATIIFSFLGYTTQEKAVSMSSQMNITMVPETQTMDEIVVTGYGSSKKSDLTGSVSSLSSKNIQDFKTGSVVAAMGGQIAGVQITQMDGSPGAGFDIKIRGVGTLNGDAGPMFVVDGFQVDNIDYLANSDIESMEFLKDASAAAIYGARAANGVIMVTTKSGKSGRPIISYSGSANYRDISKQIELMTPYEFVELQMEVNPARNANTYYRTGNDSNGIPYKYQSLEDYRNLAGIDWQDQVFKPTWSQDHNVSVMGGNESTTYNLSFSHYNENGLFNNSSFKKTTAKLRLTQKIFKNLKLDATVNYVNSDKQGVSTSADGGRFNILAQILTARPTGGLKITDEELLHSAIDPLFLDDGSSLAQVNPIAQTESVTNSKRADMWQAQVSLNWNIVKGLTFRTAGTYRMENVRNDLFYKDGSKEAFRNGKMPYGQTTDSRNLRWTNFNYLTYEQKIKKHTMSVMVGQEMNYRNDESLMGQAKEFPFDFLGNDNLGLGALPSRVNSGYAENTLISFFARVNYNFGSKYLLTGTFRTDGSSVFSAKNKWANAPSFSGAWRVSEEKFMKQLQFVSNLKIRVGWGILGNDRIPNHLSLALYSPSKYGIGNTISTVLQPKHKPNPNLKWEGSTTTNLGIDLGLFNNRLTASADFFIKDTKDLLMQKSLPYVSGFSYQWQNVGSIRNKGIELSLSSVNFDTKSGFRWTTDFNISFIRNTLVKLQPGETHMFTATGFDSNFKENDYVAMIGSSLGLMYGYQWDGVYQSSDFNVNAATGALELKQGVADNLLYAKGVQPGVVKYKDIDGDGKITTADRTVIGNGNPDFFGGLTNTFFYKNFDLSVMLQFQYGNDIYNATRLYSTQSQLDRLNMFSEVADRWTPTNATSKVPSATGQITNSVYSRFIEDGSFLRLKNITLGYSVPLRWISKLHISRLRAYVSAQNLFVISNYTGYDPEVSMRASNPLTPGIDWGAYPRSKVWTFGLDIQF